MHQRLVPQGVLLVLLASAIMLLVALALLAGLSRLLAATGDAAGSLVLDYIALACGAILVFDLVVLVLVLSLNALAGGDDRPEAKP